MKKYLLFISFFLISILLACSAPGSSSSKTNWKPISLDEFFSDTIWSGKIYSSSATPKYGAWRLHKRPNGDFLYSVIESADSEAEALNRVMFEGEFIVRGTKFTEKDDFYWIRITGYGSGKERKFQLHKSGKRGHVHDENDILKSDIVRKN
ncbi:MAG: hypothetical protein ACRCVN_04835 [Spirochaetia bacterium]